MLEKKEFSIPSKWKKWVRPSSFILFLMGSGWVYWSFSLPTFYWPVFLFGLIFIGNSILIFLDKSEQLLNYYAGVIALSVVYLLAELLVTLSIMSGFAKAQPFWPEVEIGVPTYPYFSKPMANYDSISGFRWIEKGRVVKIADGNLVYDASINPNQQGYLSSQNYVYEKADSHIIRIVILGDAYTEGFFLEENWPRKIQNHFDKEKTVVEVYSFALSGTGISNWNSQYFKEIAPFYDFDVLVLACFGGNLDQDFFAMHHEGEKVYFGSNHDNNSSFSQQSLDSLRLVIGEDGINQQVALSTGGKETKSTSLVFPLMTRGVNFFRARNGFNRYFSEGIDFARKYVSGVRWRSGYRYSFQNHKKKVGEQKAKWLEEIIDHAKSNQKQVILAAIPDQTGMRMRMETGYLTMLEEQIRFLSDEKNVLYFSGYEALAHNIRPDSLYTAYIPLDGHWSQVGSDAFAAYFFQFLTKGPSQKIFQQGTQE